MYQPTFPQYAQPYGTMQYQPPAMPQQMPPVQQQRAITGRMVGALSEIVPNEVPMDGTIAYFPTVDGSAVFAKAWNPNGTISTMRYALVEEGEPTSEAQPTIADVLDGIDDLRTLLRGNIPAEPKPARKTAKKGSDDDSSD